MISVVFAVCKAKDLKTYLDMSNRDIKEFGDITVKQFIENYKKQGSVIVPFRNIDEVTHDVDLYIAGVTNAGPAVKSKKK